MSTTYEPGPPGAAPPGTPEAAYADIHASAEFAELRRRFRRFVFPVTGAFLAWYALYVLLANYAGSFMATKVVGNVNIALVLGLLQFVTTFGIAWWYAKKAERDFDPLADRLRHEFEESVR
ncbi:MAG: DUF485 domain-containing protein [Dehalococcoidia bacterium]